MAKDILKEIVERRLEDIRKKGIEFAFNIPEKRKRKIHPFIPSHGVILEIKRASPSKGDIAPDLDSAKTARSYCQAGANAISCLTETNYFKGSLQDLMNVCNEVDSFEKESGKTGPAVLRKDFLLDEKEIEVSYRAGADAVLLIARILSKEKILKMAKKAEELGISVLLEVRKEDDLEKLEYIMQNVNHKYILCGVNSRDLKTFSIDMLYPAKYLNRIRSISPDARVTFESGLLSAQACRKVRSMGFNAILLGEAASKEPEKARDFTEAFNNAKESANGKFFLSLCQNKFSENNQSKNPLIKICGITNTADAEKAVACGADFLGFVMWHKSKRCIEKKEVINIVKQIDEYCKNNKISRKIFKTAVVVEKDLPETKDAIELISEGILDCLQLHSYELSKTFAEDPELSEIPHYCAVNINSESDIEKLDSLNKLGEARILIDAQTESEIGGTGKRINEELLYAISKKYKLWIAGGINSENVTSIIEKHSPEFLDLSSSIEIKPGIKDNVKIEEFFNALKR